MRKSELFFLVILALLPGVLLAQSCPSAGGGKDYSNKNLTDVNFTALPPGELIGANFTNSILNGAQFQNVNLTNANFTGAVMRRSANSVTDLSGAVLDHTCFQNARMDSVNLQFATFKATDFSRASLLYSSFGPMMNIQQSGDGIRTRFINTAVDFVRFPIDKWPSQYWGYTDLSNSRIVGISNQNFSFRGKDISNAILKGMSFTNYDFRGCNMTGADFSNANLDYALMDGSIMNGAKLIEAKLNYAQLSGVSFYDPSKNVSADLSGAVLNNANLHRSNFTFAKMNGASMLGATADSCNFSNASFQSTTTYNVANFSGANISNSVFTSSQLNGVNMSNSYIVRGQFNGLTLMGTNFSGATMPMANFQDCKLQGVLFTGAILQGVNFTSASMTASSGSGSGVDFSCTQLGGANFSSATVTQANFANAVMPIADSCCRTPSGSYCGIIAINQSPYGATTLPVLTNKVNCPNGDIDTCKGNQWVVPNWRTKACNKDQETQTVWFKPDCNGQDTAGRITFRDPALEASISMQLFGVDRGRVITRNIAAQVLSLNCSGKGISNLEGIQYFTALQMLDLSNNNIEDVNLLTRLKKLNKLKVSQNRLTQLNLQGIPGLNFLDASNNLLNSITFDANSYVSFLDLSHNQLVQVQDEIPIQTSLIFLDLSNNRLTNVGDLSGLTRANTIYLQNNSLTTIGNIASLYNNGAGNLTYMNLSCNLPFQCNTLGLNSTPAAINFLATTQCGNNSLPGCRTYLSPKSHTPHKHKRK